MENENDQDAQKHITEHGHGHQDEPGGTHHHHKREEEEQLNAKQLWLANHKHIFDAYLDLHLGRQSRSQNEFDRLNNAAYLALLNAVVGQTNAMVASQTGMTQNQSTVATALDRLMNVNEDSYVARGIIQDQTSGSVNADALRAIVAVEIAKALSAATKPQEHSGG